MSPTISRPAALALIAAAALPAGAQAAVSPIDLDFIGRTPAGGEATAEIASFDPATDRVFATDADNNELDIFGFSNPASPTLIDSVDLSPYGGGPNSVAYSPRFGGIVAVAVQNATVGVNGTVEVFDTSGAHLQTYTAGFLPDMLTFAKGGDYLLVANEGEPDTDGSPDPVGSVSVIDLRPGLASAVVTNAGFAGVPLEGPVRIFPAGSNVTENLEPEYITTSGDRAWVSIQEANAIGVLDIPSATFSVVKSLGFKNHGVAPNALDPTDTPLNPYINLHQSVFGMYQPDAISAFTVNVTVPLTEAERQAAINEAVSKALAEQLDARVDAIVSSEESQDAIKDAERKAARRARKRAERKDLSAEETRRKVRKAKQRAREKTLKQLTEKATAAATAAITAEATASAPTTKQDPRTYVATANEGDSREWAFFNETSRVSSLPGGLEASQFESSAANPEVIGRLTVTTTLGNTDADPAYEQVYAFGGRSMSLLDVNANMVDDTGDELENLNFTLDAANFNKDNSAGSAIDNRSDNKGPEPEAVDTGQVGGRTYAFVGAERSGGIYAYDLENVLGQATFAGGDPAYRGYINTRNADIGPEGIEFVSAADSPTGSAMILVSYEISGTVAAYSVTRKP